MFRLLSDIAVDPVADMLENDPQMTWMIIGIVAAVAVITAVVITILVKKKKRSK